MNSVYYGLKSCIFVEVDDLFVSGSSQSVGILPSRGEEHIPLDGNLLKST